MALHIMCACPTPIKGLGCIVICVKCEGGNSRTPQLLCLPHAHKGARMLSWSSVLHVSVGYVGGGVRTPPPTGGGVGHLSVCGYAKILGGWVPELTPRPPPPVVKQNPVQHAPEAECPRSPGVAPRAAGALMSKGVRSHGWYPIQITTTTTIIC